MSAPWWGKDVPRKRAVDAAEAVNTVDADRLVPITEVEAEKIEREIDDRRAGFTPIWTSRRPDDPGVALLKVYAAQHALVAANLDHLPTRARVEHLTAAGVTRAAPRPLVAMLVFELSPSAPGGVTIGERFEVFGRDAAGTLVTFETDRTITAVPATLSVLGRRTGGSVGSLTIPKPDEPTNVYPFGLSPRPGDAMYLGLEATALPGPQLAVGVWLAPVNEMPPAVSAGGLFPRPGVEPPRLAWELFDGRRFVAAEVIRDESRAFTQSGVIELVIPPSLRPGRPPGTDDGPPLYWARCQLLAGDWPAPPAFSFIALNAVPASSGRTLRDEVVETPTTVDPKSRRTLRLAESPVLDGTLSVKIDEGGSTPIEWKPVDDLSTAGFEDRKFKLDPVTGTMTFGDGRNGRPLPEGFRHVRATYRAASIGGAVAAGAISTLVGSAPFLLGVKNPFPASGGAEPESFEAALARGPREIRARKRAVAAADYEVLARSAPGADIQRAHAVGGLHPQFPGVRIPGVVGVFVVGAKRLDGKPPIPTEATLQAVTKHLAAWAPRGAEVVAVAPEFHGVRVEATFELTGDPTLDVTQTIHDAARKLDTWFDPVAGGPSREGWPFGGTIDYDALIRFLLRELAGKVVAIPTLLLVVNGVRSTHCTDVAIPEHGLLWPAPHQLLPLPRRPR
jgi:Baseplate J-like protein